MLLSHLALFPSYQWLSWDWRLRFPSWGEMRPAPCDVSSLGRIVGRVTSRCSTGSSAIAVARGIACPASVEWGASHVLFFTCVIIIVARCSCLVACQAPPHRWRCVVRSRGACCKSLRRHQLRTHRALLIWVMLVRRLAARCVAGSGEQGARSKEQGARSGEGWTPRDETSHLPTSAPRCANVSASPLS
jgi:hypothetical protein